MVHNGLHHQRGLTMISSLVVLGIILFFATVAIKMVPSYLENFAINDVMKGMANDASLRDESRSNLKEILLKRFQVNQVYDFDPSDIKITSTKRGTQIEVDYEVRKPVIGNVSVVMAFSNKVELGE